MRRFTILLATVAVALQTGFCGTEPMNVNTANGHVKETSSGVGATAKPFNARDVEFVGLYKPITFIVDGLGSAVPTGTGNPIKVLESGTIKAWTLMGKPSGSVTIDILRSANGAGLPVTSIIGAGTKPLLSGAVENSSISITNWTSITLNAKDNLAISLSGVTDTTYCVLTLYYK